MKSHSVVELELIHTLLCFCQSDFIDYLIDSDLNQLSCSSKLVYLWVKLSTVYSTLNQNNTNSENLTHNLKKLIHEHKVTLCISYQYFKEKLDSSSFQTVFSLRSHLFSLFSIVLISFYYENSIFNVSSNREDVNETTIDKISCSFLFDLDPELKKRTLDFPSRYYYLQYDSDNKKWGLHARRVIPIDSFFLIYFGELITTKETKRRYTSCYDHEVSGLPSLCFKLISLVFSRFSLLFVSSSFISLFFQGNNYVLSIKEHLPSPSNCSFSSSLVSTTHSTSASLTPFLRTNIDATQYGGLSRFINHSCSPNSEVVLGRENVSVFVSDFSSFFFLLCFFSFLVFRINILFGLLYFNIFGRFFLEMK
jgi:hypothetical protein